MRDPQRTYTAVQYCVGVSLTLSMLTQTPSGYFGRSWHLPFVISKYCTLLFTYAYFFTCQNNMCIVDTSKSDTPLSVLTEWIKYPRVNPSVTRYKVYLHFCVNKAGSFYPRLWFISCRCDSQDNNLVLWPLTLLPVVNIQSTLIIGLLLLLPPTITISGSHFRVSRPQNACNVLFVVPPIVRALPLLLLPTFP